jgi:hypothetical protein
LLLVQISWLGQALTLHPFYHHTVLEVGV